MPMIARLFPALIGFFLLGAMLSGSGTPQANLCRLAPRPLAELCVATGSLAVFVGGLALAAIAISLILLFSWQRSRPRAISYDSDAGRWIVIGWFLAITGVILLLAGLVLIGTGGWPFSEQSRHVRTSTGQLPIVISTVKRRYLVNYAGTGAPAVCAGFGEVTIRNLSTHRNVTLELRLLATPRDSNAAPIETAMPSRADLNAIARRLPQSLYRNPVALGPREELRRELVFVIRSEDPTMQAAPDLSERRYELVLEVRDLVSGRQISMSLPAEYRG